MQQCYAHWNESVDIHVYIFPFKGKKLTDSMYRCDVFQKQQSGCSVGSGLKEYRGLSDKICCTVLEKHNITPKSI